MRNPLYALALAAGVAFGLGLAVPASATPASGAIRALETATIGADSSVHLASRHWRDRDRRHWRDRRGHGDRRWRHHRRSGPSIYFEFAPAPYIYAPAPRYHVPRRHIHRLSAAHIAWCHARYRSYRAWDNTFQPYHGPRRICVSPYY